MSSIAGHVDVAHRYAAAFNDRDLDAFDAILTADCVNHHLPPDLPPGPAGARLFLPALWASLDARLVIEDIAASDELVACRLTLTGTQVGEFQGVAATGRSFTISMMTFDRFVDDRIAERWESVPLMDLLQQIGADRAA